MLSPLHFSDFQISHNEYRVCFVEEEHVKFRKDEGRMLAYACSEWSASIHRPLVVGPCPYTHSLTQSTSNRLLPTTLSRRQIPHC